MAPGSAWSERGLHKAPHQASGWRAQSCLQGLRRLVHAGPQAWLRWRRRGGNRGPGKGGEHRAAAAAPTCPGLSLLLAVREGGAGSPSPETRAWAEPVLGPGVRCPCWSLSVMQPQKGRGWRWAGPFSGR